MVCVIYILLSTIGLALSREKSPFTDAYVVTVSNLIVAELK